MAVSKIADVIGRKKTIILSGLIWVIGSILQCAAQVKYAPYLREGIPRGECGGSMSKGDLM